MRFLVPRQLLLKNLQTVSALATANAAIPIINHVLFQVHDNILTLTATDLESTLVINVTLSDSEGEGSLVVPQDIILETLKNLPDVPVAFDINEETFAIEMSADDTKYQLVGNSSSEFPVKPELTNVGTFTIDAKTLTTAISKTIGATGTSDIRPVMTGIFCELHPDHITFVATDAHQLARYNNMGVKTGMEGSFILPKKPMQALKSALQSLDGTVTIEFNESQVSFTIDSMQMISKLIEGKYPNYAAVIPANNNNILQIERASLLQRMKSIAPYTSQATSQIRIKIENDHIKMTAEDIDKSSKATTTMPCQFENADGIEDYEIGFSVKYLLEILNNLDTPEVIFKFAQPTSAGLIYPLYETETEEDILMLLMPVMLNV